MAGTKSPEPNDESRYEYLVTYFRESSIAPGRAIVKTTSQIDSGQKILALELTLSTTSPCLILSFQLLRVLNPQENLVQSGESEVMKLPNLPLRRLQAVENDDETVSIVGHFGQNHSQKVPLGVMRLAQYEKLICMEHERIHARGQMCSYCKPKK